MTIIVHPSALGDDLVLRSGERGWEPSVAYVAVGGIVRWRSDPISWAGVSNTKVWLLSPDFDVLDTLDLSGGSATRRFDKAGTIWYCSGGCWDPPDFGVVYVH